MRTLLLAWLSLMSTYALAELKLPSIIDDNMVLQRETTAPVWGWDAPGNTVTVTFRDKTVNATAGEDGRWTAKLDTGKAGGPFPLSIKGSSEVELKNVMVGEVWIAGGQSNMWWHVAKCSNAKEEIANADHPKIRLWDANTHSRQSGYQADTPQDDVKAKWKVCSPKMIGNYPGVPYFFARFLQNELEVPVGIVHVAIPGSAIEPFISPQTAEAKGIEPIVIQKKKRKKVIKPSVSWNGTVHPAVPFAARGFIWWQGEGNQSNYVDYRKRFPELIQDWRARWQLPEAPFLFVELHGFGPKSEGPVEEATFPAVRDAQRRALELPNTAMIAVPDILDEPTWQIHPPNKQLAGKRLGLAALNLAYGREDVMPGGPRVARVQFKDGKTIVQYSRGSGMELKGDPSVTGFALAGEDRKWHPADAKIQGDTITVTSDAVKEPIALRYNFVNNPKTNLYNKQGLPALQYRSDDWPLPQDKE